ncbi:hypothetical protein LF65_01696 [Clostridium beijerinckii]|uniref:Uncharacterized protein n=1 Tax=Clostridium beijerinckii TaxID=1520 RepID=A0A0B5Q804_CLOBE|nr:MULTISPECIES: hypothetical protein [Clostridium]AJG98299.1 hypothetical protein LF65_01696 [Clostridium beijerinckii]
MPRTTREFTHLSKEIINEPCNNIWKIKMSPEASKNKNINYFIEKISDEGLTSLAPFIDKDYKLVALHVNIQKAIYIYTLKEWKFYDM